MSRTSTTRKKIWTGSTLSAAHGHLKEKTHTHILKAMHLNVKWGLEQRTSGSCEASEFCRQIADSILQDLRRQYVCYWIEDKKKIKMIKPSFCCTWSVQTGRKRRRLQESETHSDFAQHCHIVYIYNSEWKEFAKKTGQESDIHSDFAQDCHIVYIYNSEWKGFAKKTVHD